MTLQLLHSEHMMKILFYFLSVQQEHKLCYSSRGRFLGGNPDKSLKGFPPCYSLSPPQLCLEIIYLQTHATSYSFYSSCCTLWRIRRKTWKKTIPLSLWFKKSIPQVWELSSLCSETSMKLYVHEFCFSISAFSVRIHGRPRALVLSYIRSELTDSLQKHSSQAQRTGTQTEANQRRTAQWKHSTQIAKRGTVQKRTQHSEAQHTDAKCTDTHRRTEHWTHSSLKRNIHANAELTGQKAHSRVANKGLWALMQKQITLVIILTLFYTNYY